jgi:conjugal transfer pilus assembly protein TraU
MRGCHKLYLLTSLKNISHLQTSVKVCRYLSAILSLFISLVVNEAQAQCTGRFVNPITDVCWECLFPISIGGVEISQGIAPDAGNSGSPICMCGVPVPRIGVSTGFWEPVRLVDVTKEPFCFPTLGGMQMGMGMDLGRGSSPGSNNNGTAFWHIHYYVYPLVYWLELITDFACMEMDSFDIAYMTELDPLWGDDSLTFLLNPEAVLFSNPIAQAACSADCIKSSIGTPFDDCFGVQDVREVCIHLMAIYRAMLALFNRLYLQQNVSFTKCIEKALPLGQSVVKLYAKNIQCRL